MGAGGGSSWLPKPAARSLATPSLQEQKMYKKLEDGSACN